MANQNRPSGFTVIGHKDGSPWAGTPTAYYIPSTDTDAYYLGDLVVSTPGASDGAIVQQGHYSIGVPMIAKAVAGDQPRGVLVGIKPDVIGGAPRNVPAIKTRGYIVYVVDDPDVTCLMWGDNTTTLANTCVNSYANYTVTAPTASQGTSATVLATATIDSADATLPLRILGLRGAVNDGFGAYVPFLVCFNLHELG